MLLSKLSVFLVATNVTSAVNSPFVTPPKSATVLPCFANIAFAKLTETFAIKKEGPSFFLRYMFPFVSVGVLRGKLSEITNKPAAPFALALRIFAIGEAGLALNARFPP